jgi:hypothetical protein
MDNLPSMAKLKAAKTRDNILAIHGRTERGKHAFFSSMGIKTRDNMLAIHGQTEGGK